MKSPNESLLGKQCAPSLVPTGEQNDLLYFSVLPTAQVDRLHLASCRTDLGSAACRTKSAGVSSSRLSRHATRLLPFNCVQHLAKGDEVRSDEKAIRHANGTALTCGKRPSASRSIS